MADDVVLPGAGTTIATDDIGSGRQAQLIKLLHGADGTATMVAAGDGLPVQSGWKELTGSGAATNADLVSADVSGYRWVSVQVSGTYSGTVSFQHSNDGTTWSLTLLAGASTPVSSTSSAGLWAGPVSARYFRARLTSYTSGTATATVELSAAPSQYLSNYVYAGSAFSVTGGMSAATEPQAGPSSFAAPTMLFNGTNWDRGRTPTTFKSATATASGNTALWTPTSGKRFRLMRFKVDVSQDAAQTTGGVITVGLQDNTTDIGVSQSVFVPTTAATAMGSGWSSGWIDLGGGKASAAINQVLNTNLSAALTSGVVRVLACGTEE